MNGFLIGEHANRPGVKIYWDPDSDLLTNAHMLIAGSSGGGKTTLLKKIAKWLYVKNKHIFIYDLKGDMQIYDNNHNLIGNYIEFTAWGNRYGMHPFRFDKGLPDSELKQIVKNKIKLTNEQKFKIQNSGPKVQTERIIEMLIKNILPNMGTTQKEVTRYLLNDVYLSKGIINNDISTWYNEIPSFDDVVKLINSINEYYGQKKHKEYDSQTKKYIYNYMKLIAKINKLKINNEIEEIEAAKKELSVLQKQYNNHIIGSYTLEDIEYFNNEKNYFVSKGVKLEKYGSKENLKAINTMLSHFEALLYSGVFHSKKPPIKPGLNIINLSGLSVNIQRFIVDLFLGQSFMACKIRGDYRSKKNKKRGRKFDTVHVIDESKLIAGNNKEKNNPFSYLNRIATEARSYGMAMIVASQSATHFPQEFVKNFATQIILNTNIADLAEAKKSFGVTKEQLEFTQAGWGKALVKTGKIFTKILLSK